MGIQEFQIDPGIPVQFDLGGLVFPNTGILVPAPNGSTFTILTSGDYEFDFYVAAHVLNSPDTVEIEMAIFVNGVSAGSAHAFRGNHQTTMTANDVAVVRGQGLISLAGGDMVTLVLVAPTRLIATANASGGSQPGANRTLSLKKLSA